MRGIGAALDEARSTMNPAQSDIREAGTGVDPAGVDAAGVHPAGVDPAGVDAAG